MWKNPKYKISIRKYNGGSKWRWKEKLTKEVLKM
jgi:hypothetical protein